MDALLHPPKTFPLAACLTAPSLRLSHLSQPTCQDGLVDPEGGGFDGEDADICRDFVPHCRERSKFSGEWSLLPSYLPPFPASASLTLSILQPLQHSAAHRPSAQDFPLRPHPRDTMLMFPH